MNPLDDNDILLLLYLESEEVLNPFERLFDV